ncbi:MAG TPA: FAD-binding protein [Bacteroidia bacterium]|jgi:hypothetical protein|nr:FAD-binding protein [Bacteroidia bacterium]
MKADKHLGDAGSKVNKPISYWTDSSMPSAQIPLKENLETDVVIVGGGLAGLSIAYCLSQSGKKWYLWKTVSLAAEK